MKPDLDGAIPAYLFAAAVSALLAALIALAT